MAHKKSNSRFCEALVKLGVAFFNTASVDCVMDAETWPPAEALRVIDSRSLPVSTASEDWWRRNRESSTSEKPEKPDSMTLGFRTPLASVWKDELVISTYSWRQAPKVWGATTNSSKSTYSKDKIRSYGTTRYNVNQAHGGENWDMLFCYEAREWVSFFVLSTLKLRQPKCCLLNAYKQLPHLHLKVFKHVRWTLRMRQT